MPAIFSNILKSQKSHLFQRKPENNGPVLLSVSVVSYGCEDGYGLQLKTVGQLFQVPASCLIKFAKN